MKTADLIGPALDWAVAKCEDAAIEIGKRGDVIFDTYQDDPPAGVNEYNDSRWQMYHPSSDWSQGGPIIEREKIVLNPQYPAWCSTIRHTAETNRVSLIYFGETPLIAAMRAYVASKLGDDVEIPEELK